MKEKITVTDLSKIAVCEKQYLLNKTVSQNPNEKMIEGTKNHLIFEKTSWTQWQTKLNPQQDKRCYIATSLWGSEHEKVIFLRNFRDEVLLKNKIGRVFVKFYYYCSPIIIKNKFFNYKMVKKIMSTIINTIIWLIKC